MELFRQSAGVYCGIGIPVSNAASPGGKGKTENFFSAASYQQKSVWNAFRGVRGDSHRMPDRAEGSFPGYPLFFRNPERECPKDHT